MMSLLEKYTYPFIESIRISNGKIMLLDYHQRRVTHTFRYHFPNKPVLRLRDYINLKLAQEDTDIKCRIAYNADAAKVEFLPYERRRIYRLTPIECAISYPFKYADRTIIDNLSQGLDEFEEPLFLHQGRIKESSYSNILLKLDGEWYTPQYPIFYGIMRQYLLDSNQIKEADLFVDHLKQSQKIKLVNAMMPLEKCITLSFN